MSRHYFVLGRKAQFEGVIVKKMIVTVMGTWNYAYQFKLVGVDEPIVWNGGQNLGKEGDKVTFSAKPKEWVDTDDVRYLVLRNLHANGETRRRIREK